MTEGEGHYVMFICQMSEKFSRECFDLPQEVINESVIEKLKTLLPELKKENVKVSYTDAKLWRYALPKNPISVELVEKLKEINIFILGDSLCGKGRVDGAILTGFELHDYLKKNPSF